MIKFPYECILKENPSTKFTPILIDYDNQMVWWQKGQASENGEWIAFEDVIFRKIETFVDLTSKE